ncbi:MAG: hypothetical protein JSU57_04090 [Candidatus Heimdallarchaeota archaeon]|nr:MAG: hypothetical protein JSU57_04090 [Candidatus Heimdallarchaeota archaeon]
MKVVDKVCEKIKPHLTIDYQSGRKGVKDFRELLKRIDFTPHERQYLGSNFRFVITKLGLFHYLPEIQGNEDAAVFQLIEVVTENWISSGIVKNRSAAATRLIQQIKDRIQDRASTLITVSEAGDLRIMIQSLRENVSNFWEKSPERIPEFIDQFRDALSETSQSSRLLYDIASFNRDVRAKKVKYLEDINETIDEWEQRLFLA